MKILTEIIGKSAIVSISGDIDASNSDEVKEYLLTTLEVGWDTLVIDLKNVPFISSIGLQALLSAYQAGDRADTSVVIAAPRAGIEKVINTSGFSSFLTRYTTVDDAKTHLAMGESEPEDD